MNLEFSHTLSRDEAFARLRALGEYLTNKHKVKVEWNGEGATFTGRFRRVVKIVGRMRIDERRVHFVGEDPGVLWRGQAARYIRRKLRAYLDPAVALAELPRGP